MMLLNFPRFTLSQAGSFDRGGGAMPVLTLTGNSGGPVPPDGAGNIDVVGDGITIDVTGNPGTNTLTISTLGSVATQYDADVGSAVPALGILEVLGGENMNTEASGNTIEINLNETIHWPDTNAAGTAGVIYLGGAGGIGGTRFLHNYGPLGGANGNTYLGTNVANLIGTGFSNTAVGANSMLNWTTGAGNTAVGSSTLVGVGTGLSNTAVGYTALNTVQGSDNVAVGAGSGLMLQTANNNTLVGSSIFNNNLVNGDENVVIGYLAGDLLQAGSSNIYIMNDGSAIESNTMRLGTHGVGVGQIDRCFMGGIDGVNVGSVATVVSFDPTDDQIGETTITAGTGISITPGANTITVAATGAGAFVWAVTTVDAAIVVNNGYIANKAGLLTMTLPATAAIGDMIRITGINTAVGWRIAQNANQRIHFGASSTTLGVGGYIEAIAIRDSIELVCVVAGASTEYNVLSSIGNPTVV